MSIKFIRSETLRNIADAVRERGGIAGKIPVVDIAEKIRAIPAGDGLSGVLITPEYNGAYTVRKIATGEIIGGSSGDDVTPTLDAPTLTRSGDLLIIADDSGLAESFDVLVNGEVKRTLVATAGSTPGGGSGGGEDSGDSAGTVTPTLDAPTLTRSGDLLIITDDSGLAESFDVLVNGEVVKTYTAYSYEPDDGTGGGDSGGNITPTLNAPSLTRSGDLLIIADDSGLAESFDVLVNGEVVKTYTANSYDPDGDTTYETQENDSGGITYIIASDDLSTVSNQSGGITYIVGGSDEGE